MSMETEQGLMIPEENQVPEVAQTAPEPEIKLAIMRHSKEEMQRRMAANLAGRNFSEQDFESLSVPAGGGTFWTVPTVNGQDSVAVLEGIIIHQATSRVYWDQPYGRGGANGNMPACSSRDGITGVGNPGGNCYGCVYSQPGSADPDDPEAWSRACREYRLVYLLFPERRLPCVLRIPPGSLGPRIDQGIDSYGMRLFDFGLDLSGVITRFTLEKAIGSAGEYSRVRVNPGAELSPDQAETVAAYTASLMPHLQVIGTTTMPMANPE